LRKKDPVHFSFSTERKNDSLVYLIIKTQADTGFLLFNTKPQNTDDPFISAIKFRQLLQQSICLILLLQNHQTYNSLKMIKPILLSMALLIQQGFNIL
jgi:hypothetical protein